jgi:biopolymer transport protein ExbB
MKNRLIASFLVRASLVLTVVLPTILPLTAHADDSQWWNKEWTVRKPIVMDTTDAAKNPGGPVEAGAVLIRLHGGNFNFAAAREDGADLRFVAADGETVLPHHLESFDSLMNEGFVWVGLPEVPANEQTTFWLYYGNAEGGSSVPVEFNQTFPESTLAVFHFAERNQPARDSGPKGHNAATVGSPAEGAIIGTGVRFLGRNPITVPGADGLAFAPGQDLTLSAWLRPQTEAADAIWFSRVENGNALRLGLAGGIPFVEVQQNGTTARSELLNAETAPLPAARWTQVALRVEGNAMQLLVNGEPVATLAAALPALTGPFFLGAEDPDGVGTRNGFIGEMDEFQLYATARSLPTLLFAAVAQSGSEQGMRAVLPGEDELGSGGGHGHNETLEHVMLFGDIAKNMMFDGWIAVGVCIIMIIVGWWVGIGKFFYLNKLQKGNEIFFKLWKQVIADLNLLDENEEDQMAGLVQKLPKQQRILVKESPLYHIYHRGLEEIEARLGARAKVKMEGLSARSMQAIRASMDASFVHESHRLNNGLVFLTIGIAGGPYVGLLGTVVGVMITFALIAKTGEVEVNSIAPGIASALLATVAGLVVAIPALFIYSYLSGRIKNSLSDMQVFIDDFVAKIAEFYPPPSEKNFVPVPEIKVHAHGPEPAAVLSDAAPGEESAEATPRKP